MSVQKLLVKIEQCPDYRTLYALEPAFNDAGLTFQTTSGNRIILCKLRDGKPIAEEAVTDYIFISALKESDLELSDRVVEKICDFVANSYGPSGKVADTARVWRNGLRMYESSIVIVNEDVQYISGVMCD